MKVADKKISFSLFGISIISIQRRDFLFAESITLEDVAICDDGITKCYQGGTCEGFIEWGSTSGTEYKRECVCPRDSPMVQIKGTYCHQTANDVCHEDPANLDIHERVYYCLHGKCKSKLGAEVVVEDEAHPGCTCDSGWYGSVCELEYGNNVAVKDCTDGETTCLNDSTCIDIEEANTGVIKSYCDCFTANLSHETQFVGSQCEINTEYFESKTMSCHLNQNDGFQYSYCLHDGKCNQMIDNTQDHQGCQCTSSYVGEYCELYYEASSSNGADTSLIAGLTILSVGLLGVAIAYIKYRSKSSPSLQSVDPTTGLHGDKDGQVLVGDEDQREVI
mmetsp:Transcript_2377/g.3296  ORF Transcript_2377/g.3296 Transcript_2377/m.3296 type:complete len:334 (-) Transcript_2377:94-1095(-)|eukprot:CAMPEP_0116070078 /NCGR_PEP_ID=MMETSP0322-20121206/12767_1 /TAXON_ID=163516 /ORGANISM="Leptocylindrus danicus var. apora, Strain B651" /LENGTH=333 /DNA_ID=CAMNT_0003557761 /DNA_START=136 /DNA_END=1137 /DNA_ORIENTATION=+